MIQLTDEDMKKLDAIRDSILFSQTVCSWCNEQFANNSELLNHLSERSKAQCSDHLTLWKKGS